MSKLLCSRKANLKDYYAILGISPTSSHAEIRRAFRHLALRCHPDVNRDPEATDRFQEITVAYQTLVDPAKRAEYDAARRPGASQTSPRASHGTTESPSRLLPEARSDCN